MRRILAATLTAAGCLAATPAGAQSANAVLIDPDGKEIGNVALEQFAQGVRVFAEAADLPPGVHALPHPRDRRVRAPDFQSAGGHFNPTEEQHGWDNPRGHHAGDLPNVRVQDEAGSRSSTSPTGDPRRGRGLGVRRRRPAIVLHEGADDYQTDPAGDAGAGSPAG